MVCWTKIAPDRKGVHYLLPRPCVAGAFDEPSAVLEAAARSDLQENRDPEARVPVGYKATENGDCGSGSDDGYSADTRQVDTGQPLRRT